MFDTNWRAFAVVFPTFALLMAAGNVYAEASANLVLGRVVASILVTAVLAEPAVILFLLYDLRMAPPGVFQAWRWFWAAGFVAYATHSWLAVGAWFDWDFAQIERRQGTAVAWTNYVLLAVWGMDVLVSFVGLRAKWVTPLRWLAHLLFVLAFVVASIAFAGPAKSIASLAIGWLLAVSAGAALLVRLIWGGGSRWLGSPTSQSGVG